MTTTSEPVRWNRTIIRGTDHAWTVRRVDAGGVPIMPEAARAQIRPQFGGPIWVECDIAIDSVDGWVTISIPREETETAEWDSRYAGVWDLEVDASGKRLRWVYGDITVSPDVTRDAP